MIERNLPSWLIFVIAYRHWHWEREPRPVPRRRISEGSSEQFAFFDHFPLGIAMSVGVAQTAGLEVEHGRNFCLQRLAT